MKALSIKSIHALRIAMGQKTMEIRSKRTHYRGPLLVCVSQRPGVIPTPRSNHKQYFALKEQCKQICGHAICVVDVVGCRAMLPGDEADACHAFIPGHFVWKLANLRAIVPFPVSGQLSMFDVDDSLIVFKDAESRTNDARLSLPPVPAPPLELESRASFALV